MQKDYSASYLVGEALRYGVAEAILLNKLRYLQQFTSREDGYCWRTKEELERELGLSPKVQDRAVRHLVDLGVLSCKTTYIRDTTNRCKHYYINPESAFSESDQRAFSIESDQRAFSNNKEIILSNIVDTKVSTGENAEFGNLDINEMFDFWKKTFGVPLTSKQRLNRYACSNLLKKHGRDDLQKLILLANKARSDRYAPTIANFIDLQAKTDSLVAWAHKKVASSKNEKRMLSVEDL